LKRSQRKIIEHWIGPPSGLFLYPSGSCYDHDVLSHEVSSQVTPDSSKGHAMSDDDLRRKYKLNRISKGAHRLGLLVAAIILVAGLMLMAKDAIGLDLWDLTVSDIPILGRNLSLVLLAIGLVALAAYGIVRAIGRSISRSI
jgi:hypothetical protein